MVDRLLLSRKDTWMQTSDCIDNRIKSQMPIEKMTSLPKSFQPDRWSVVCGRGKDCFDNVGNRRLKVLAQIYLKEFISAKTKMDKSLLIMRIVDSIREHSTAGGFVKKHRKTGRWYEVGDEIAREKVSSELRIALQSWKEQQSLGPSASQPSTKRRKSEPIKNLKCIFDKSQLPCTGPQHRHSACEISTSSFHSLPFLLSDFGEV